MTASARSSSSPASPASRHRASAPAASRSRLARPAGSGESRLASSHDRAAMAGAPRWSGRRGRARRARRRPPRRGRARRGRGATPGSARPRAACARATGERHAGRRGGRRSRRPSASAGGGTRGGRPSMRDHTAGLGGLAARRGRGRCSARAVVIRSRSPSGSAAATTSAVRTVGATRRRASSATWRPDRPTGSGSGSSARPARSSASSMLAASMRTIGIPPAAAISAARASGLGDAGVDEQLVGVVVGQRGDLDRRSGVGADVDVRAAGGDDRHPLDLQLVGDVRRAPGASAGRSTGDRRRATTIGAGSAASTRRSRLATAMANGSTSRSTALEGQRRADGRGARRGEVVEAVEHPVEQLGEARPGELDLGLDAAQADHVHAVGDGAVGAARRAASSCRSPPRRPRCAHRRVRRRPAAARRATGRRTS